MRKPKKIREVKSIADQVIVDRGYKPGVGHQCVDLRALVMTDGDVTLCWRKPHGMGYAEHDVTVPLENIPKLVEKLMAVYNEEMAYAMEDQEAS